MRVLWFTNAALPAAIARSGSGAAGMSGHWMTELLARLRLRPELQLGVATAVPGMKDLQFDEDGVRYYVAGQKARAQTFGDSLPQLRRCQEFVRDFAPDLIHFHGSERFFGALKADHLTDVPAVVSLQGVLGPCAQYRGFFGSLSPRDVLRAVRLVEVPLGLGLLAQYADIQRAVRREERIVKSVEGLIGRTEWDAAHARRMNPKAAYHHVGEILREPFRSARWSIDACDRFSIIYTNAGHPRRGTEDLLAAMAMLTSEFPRISLQLAGSISTRNGYGRFLRGRIRDLGLESRVKLLGVLDAEAMSRALLKAHVFVISSYIENSPNSLAEAMCVGMPCIATFVGGIPSMLEHQRSGYLYPAGDVTLLTAHLRRVFSDDSASSRMGAAAREVALPRHDPARVEQQLMSAYTQVLRSAASPAGERL